MAFNHCAEMLIVLFCCFLRAHSSATGDPRKCFSHTQPGDIVLGGVFPLSFKSWPSCSSELSPWAVRLSEAMIFSIHEINKRDDILPNITLGFDLRDDCRSEEHAMWIALSLIHNNSVSFPETIHDDNCNLKPSGNVIGIVGSAFSETSIYLAKTAALFQVPVVSYAASSDELSDKHDYPYFLRTNAPDKIQVQVIIDLLIHFKWEYIGLMYSFQSDGFNGAFALQELAEQRGVCVAFTSPIREFASAVDLQAITEEIASYDKVKVIVLFGAKNEAQAVLRALKEQSSLRSRHIVWIGTTHWGYRLAEEDLEDVVVGSLFIRDYRPKVEAFCEYYTGLGPHSDNVSPWFREHALDWMRKHECSDLSKCPLDRGNTEGLVINSVYLYAYSLDSLIRKSCQNLGCWQSAEDVKIDGVELLAALKTTQHDGPYGRVVLDSNGDGIGKFVVSNLQLGDDGQYKMVDVGYWDAENETRLWLNDAMIQWPQNDIHPPESVCKQECSTGQAVIALQRRCCFGCLQCPDNNIVANGTCSPCQVEYWPDEHCRACLQIIPSGIPLNDPLVAVLLMAVVVGFLLCVATGLGLVAKRNHQLVKATSRELTCVHFAGLVLSFVAVLMLLVIRPDHKVCCVVESLISISFNLAYAPTLLKVARIHRIFKMGQVSASRPKFISPKSQVLVVVIMIVCQVSEVLLMR